MSLPEPVFTEPWQAQVFGVTVHLNEAGYFTWPDWSARFAQTLRRHGLEKELNGGDDYFLAWLVTLETFLSDLNLSDTAEVARLKQAWERAYLATPHGQPVHLAE